jgi:hypothetical protein
MQSDRPTAHSNYNCLFKNNKQLGLSKNAGGGNHSTGRFKIPCSCTKNTRYLKIQLSTPQYAGI